MRTIIQRVTSASVDVDGKTVGRIGTGFLILVGFTDGDTEADCIRIAKKIGGLRIFSDENDKINLSLADVGGEILCISQFTLYADCTHGYRPSFIKAARPETAQPLYDFFCVELEKYAHTERGIFGADMKVSLLNDGPFTVMIE
ncbi:MAG: D-aminoacyl-tRNA deacylase [Oscillospiraceae bacterium]|nr:D-aminoacyl-tRNA deacylase [Oscillospiraceae bacterium]MDD7279551.1 D-aminoacyl-tRNA deacylase [Oscillospiraceae bacterium]MDY2863433.1 D-aminoacyl-tRNA deacylase [Oscillospiraceae bacterium]